jgi:1,2-diacylglycerol 3-alpha-glucosyltransferase
VIVDNSSTSPAVQTGLPKDTRVAVLFHRLGPYHHARLKAAGSLLQVTGVEFSNVDQTYAWDLVKGAHGFKRVTLFSEEAVDALPASRIFSRVDEALDQLRPHVVAIPGWHDRCSLAALQWCRSRGVPAVVMSETTAWDTKRSWWKEFLKSRIVQLFAAALVGGHSHAEYLERLGVEPRKIFLGYDAVDNDYFASKAAEIRNQESEFKTKHGLPENYFLASARFIGKKNLVRLIQAYARYREIAGKSGAGNGKQEIWHLVLLGDGPLKSDLCDLISGLGLEQFVHLPGFKQYDELPGYYGLARAFIHASTIEPWGLVVNEAMASSLPVLVSDRCGCAVDLVQEGANGFTFDPYSVEDLAKLMHALSARHFPLSDYGLKSKQIMQMWSPDQFAANMKAACELAIANERSGKIYFGHCITNLLIHLPKKILQSPEEKLVASRNASTAGVKVVPNFFIIGAPKSGTTSLSEYLKDHPNIFFSPVKEPHFFDLDTSKRLKIKLPTYLSLFSDAKPEVHKAVGEGSTGYLFSKVAVREILKFNPDAKFIVMLRNPVELVQSWHSEMYFEGVENIIEFEKAWRLEPERRNGRNIPGACWEPKKLFYSEWGKLGDQMERVCSIVPKDRLKVIMFDDFVRNTKGVYEDVLSFLGVPLEGRNDFHAVNENKSLRYPWLQRSLAFTANHFRRVRVATGLNLNLGGGLSQRLLILNSKPAARKRISPELREELANFFREDIQKLARLLDRDLSHWISSPRV